MYLQFDVCKSKLPQLETSINRTIGINANDKATTDYCFLHLDDDWETLDSCGMWTNDDYALLEKIRNYFSSNDVWNNCILRYGLLVNSIAFEAKFIFFLFYSGPPTQSSMAIKANNRTSFTNNHRSVMLDCRHPLILLAA